MYRFILPILLCLQLTVSAGSLQSVAVKGKLLCNNKPYANAKVKLWELDFADPNDLLDQGVSKKDGTYFLHGNETEITQIEVKINIYHNCNDETVECLRKVQIEIPEDYITYGPNPKKVFDAGILNLNAILPGEE
jgi:hypothetical protein